MVGTARTRDLDAPGRTVVKGASTLGALPDSAHYTIGPHFRCAFIHIICIRIETFQISVGVMFYTQGRLLNNWSVLRMRPPLRSEG